MGRWEQGIESVTQGTFYVCESRERGMEEESVRAARELRVSTSVCVSECVPRWMYCKRKRERERERERERLEVVRLDSCFLNQ